MTQAIRIYARAALAAVAAVLGAQPAFAQRGSEVTVEVSDCLQIEAPVDRLACFERRVAETREGQETAPAAPAARPAAPAAQTPPAAPPAPAARAPAPADDDFGRSRPSRRDERAARELESRELEERARLDGPRTQLVATVVSIRETIPNAFTITLDNGQVWRQNRPEFYPLRAGHEVRIYPGKIGSSYRLTAPAIRGQIQVERVR